MTATVRVVLVDDSAEDLKHARRLSESGLPCTPLAPPESLQELRQEIEKLRKDGHCDLVLLDYRLDQSASASGRRRMYRGGAVVTDLKEHYPDLPVVLLTTEDKLEQSRARTPQIEQLFDHRILKERLSSRRERPTIISELRALAEGFQAIKAVTASCWKGLFKLLDVDATDVGLESVSRGTPPRGTTDTAQWLLRRLFAYAGPLIDGQRAAAMLGITNGTFARKDVQEALEECRYKGIFSDWHERWWRGCVQRWLTQAADGPGYPGGKRAGLVADAVGVSRRSVRAAKCIWCGGRDVARVCSTCKEAVDQGHALTISDDSQPNWTEPAVVCYRCIATGRAERLQFQPGTESIVRALKQGTLTPEV